MDIGEVSGDKDAEVPGSFVAFIVVRHVQIYFRGVSKTYTITSGCRGSMVSFNLRSRNSTYTAGIVCNLNIGAMGSTVAFHTYRRVVNFTLSAASKHNISIHQPIVSHALHS